MEALAYLFIFLLIIMPLLGLLFWGLFYILIGILKILEFIEHVYYSIKKD